MIIDENIIDKIYQELTSMEVQLDLDPLEFGPDRLNNKTAEVRNLLTRVEKIFMDLSQNYHKYKRDLLINSTEFNIAKTRLMVDDPHVRAGRSQTERETLAEVRLTDMSKKIKDLEVAVQDLDELLKVVKAKRADLKDIQNRLKDQLKLAQESLNLGRRWGKSDPVVKVLEEFKDDYVAVTPSIDDTVLNSVLNERTEVKEQPNGKNENKDIDNFFSSEIDTDKKKIEELNLDDLWNV